MRDQQAAEQRDVARLIQAEQIRNEPAGEKQKDRGEQPDNAGNDQTAPNQPVNRLQKAAERGLIRCPDRETSAASPPKPAEKKR